MVTKRASELVGKNVYDASASFIGTVVDVELNSDKASALIVSTQGMNPAKTSRAVSRHNELEAQWKLIDETIRKASPTTTRLIKESDRLLS